MHKTHDLDALSPAQLRQMVSSLQTRVSAQDAAIQERDAAIRHHKLREEKLTQEIALLRRHRFGRKSESLSGHQQSLLEELVDEDIAALESAVDKLKAQPE